MNKSFLSCLPHDLLNDLPPPFFTQSAVAKESAQELAECKMKLVESKSLFESFVTLKSTAYCILRVISPISKLNQSSSSLLLFGHVPLKRDQFN